jgi:hypothetical protein
LGGFVRSLSATWRIFLLRFALAFLVLGLGWWLLAHNYAHLLALLGRPFVPFIERQAETIYRVEGATILATRSLTDPATQKPVQFEFELWKGYASYDVILLVALIVATPGWPLARRVRLIGIGLVLITLTELAFYLSTIEFSQLRPLRSPSGSVILQPGFSRPRQVVFTWVYYFFQAMGRGMFPLLIYLGMVGITWGTVDQRGPRRPPRTARSPNPKRSR